MQLASIARGLIEMAIEIVTYERPVTRLQYYEPAPETGLARTPIVPPAIHDALCYSAGSVSVELHDPDAAVLVCYHCKLAVEVTP